MRNLKSALVEIGNVMNKNWLVSMVLMLVVIMTTATVTMVAADYYADQARMEQLELEIEIMRDIHYNKETHQYEYQG